MRGRRGTLALALAIAFAASFAGSPAASGAIGDRSDPQLALVVSASDGHRVIELWDLETSSPVRVMVDLGDRDAIQPDWSPDGERLVYAAQTRSGGPYAIFTSDPDGTNLDIRQITSPVGATTPADGDFSPAWSPDGVWLLFARTIGTTSSIYWSTASGGLQGRVTFDIGYEVEPTWMPDSMTVIYADREFLPEPGQDPNHPAYHFQVLRADGLHGFPILPSNITSVPGTELHTPSVSPNGTRIAVSETSASSGATVSALITLTAPPSITSGTFLGDRDPDWSQDGTKIVADSAGQVVVTNLADGGNGGNAPGSDAAWRPTEKTPPLVTITPHLDRIGWLATSAVSVDAQDASGVAGVSCRLDGAPIEVLGSSVGTTFSGSVTVDGPEGSHTLACTATDTVGNAATTSAGLMVDFEAPRLGELSVSPTLAPLGQPISISTAYEENGSGLAFASVELTSPSYSPGATMSANGGELEGSVTPIFSGIYNVVVHAFDNREQGSSVVDATPIVVFDPSRGSVSGSGWIVPLGSTSDAGDTLPGIDGRSKASFGFSARYVNTKNTVATTPTGSLNFSYGSQFRLQSTAMSWLVVTWPTATLQGTAAIKGQAGAFTFQLEVLDAATDRFELRVWAAASNPFIDPPVCQATGNAGGQSQVTP